MPTTLYPSLTQREGEERRAHLIPFGCLVNRFLIVGSYHEVAPGAMLGHMGQHQLQTASVTEEIRTLQHGGTLTTC